MNGILEKLNQIEVTLQSLKTIIEATAVSDGKVATYSYIDVQAVAKSYFDMADYTALATLLSKFNATKLSDIEPEEYDDFVEITTELIKALEKEKRRAI